MKERPIIFSAPMVRALLDGRKTQTRRIIAPPRSTGAFVLVQGFWRDQPESWWPLVSMDGESMDDGKGCETPIACPYGTPGDRLWVRETFMFSKGADIRESFIGNSMEVMLGKPPHYAHRATQPHFGEGAFKWRPAIHMPRHASRITLEITDVRVQLLQEISEGDAQAEGVERRMVGEGWREYGLSPEDETVCGPPMPTGAASYRTLWDSINGKGAWDANPWVWSLTFNRVPQ